MYSEAVDDPKLRLLAFEDRWHFVALLCCKAQGILDSNSELLERQLGVKLGLQMRELEELKRRLQEVHLVGSNWEILNWCKRQFKSDSSADRVKKHRAKQLKEKEVSNCNVTETLLKRKSNVLDTDTEHKNICSKSKKESDFETFWSDYPRKQNKKKSQSAFFNLSASNRKKAMADIKTRFLQTDPKYIPLPTTYLNGERWEDENNSEPKTFGRVIQ